MIAKRVERHIIDRQNMWYPMLVNKCFLARNIYNHGNYIIRQKFFDDGTYIPYEEIEKLLHDDLEYPDYWNLGLANSSQQILRTLDKNWKSFFKAIKDYKKNPDKYLGIPKPPKYLKGNTLKEFALTYAQISEINGYIVFPKSMSDEYGNRMKIRVRFAEMPNYKQFKLCRIIPRNDRIIIEFVYTIEINPSISKNHNVASIDLGIDNFVTLVDNIGNKPIIINGKGLKSCNQYYNKMIAKTQSNSSKSSDYLHYTHRLNSITNKRNNKVEYFMHKASRIIVNYCMENNISTIVVGKNDEWKQNVYLGKVNNQKFVSIPFNSFINKLIYKCENVGIEIILTEESYTSGTSFLDGEMPDKSAFNKSRRIKRGLFKSNQGKLINADVNAAYQIMKKVFRDVEIPTDRGFVINPVCISFTF